jgi:ACT domain-containing protein
MAVVSALYNAGANILTVNLGIPVGGTAVAAITADVNRLDISVPQLLDRLRRIDGVNTIESISGN